MPILPDLQLSKQNPNLVPGRTGHENSLLFSQVFYNKTLATYDAFASPPPSFNLTDELTTPCDQDEDKLAADVCATYNNDTALPVEYLNCSRVTDNYPNTVNLISDLRYE